MKAEKLSLMNEVLILSRTLVLLGVSFVIFICSSLVAKADESVLQQQQYSIEQGPLGKVLSTFALSANIDFSIDDSLTTGKSSSGLEGVYSVRKGLQKILLNTGIIFEQISLTSFVLKALPKTQDASAIIIHGLRDTDEDGYNDVYDKNTSTAYMGKVEVERYKGATPSDLLQGIAGVFSGEARNSGALDVNIRGVQGPGRVPVTIDGTEQALTVWRGYNGASNRSYIDPNLISNIQVYKGVTNERDVNSGIGGAMVVKTLVPDDIISDGEDFGIEFKMEGSSNSVGERVPRLHTGELAVDVNGFPQGTKAGITPVGDETLRLKYLNAKSANDNNPLAGGDYSYRVAAAKKTEDFDFLAAYAYRQRGNYYSGKNNASYYSDSEAASGKKDFIRSLANYWKPGEEVLNTSSMMESILLKSTWNITDNQQLSFNYRESNTVYGEIMPSRINTQSERGFIQWPLSEVTSKASNLDYVFKPNDNPWVDLHVKLWRTDTLSDTYTAGGYPNQLQYALGADDPLTGILVDGAISNSKNIRDGVSLSNNMNLSAVLDLTVAGNFQHEKLSSADEYDKTLARAFPRAGRREEWDTSLNLAWKTTDRLKINAGLTYSSYWSYDDFLGDHPNEFKSYPVKGYDIFGYDTYVPWTAAERQAEIDTAMTPYTTALGLGLISQAFYDNRLSLTEASTPYGNTTEHDKKGLWLPDADGNLDRAEHPCLNGSWSSIPNISQCRSSAIPGEDTVNAEKVKDHGWVPHFNVSYELTDDSRVYVKYAEAIRYPSMFESTIGWSASVSQYGLNPEHSYNWELGYVHDLTAVFSEADYADLKLSAYHNLTHDVIERDTEFLFNNVDKQTIKGLELDFRYDSGKYFTNLGINYVLQNEICDEDSAARLAASDFSYSLTHSVPTCMNDGFPSGYQLAQATPKLSANLALGGRFLNRRLELGGRATYYKAHENKDLDYIVENSRTGSKDGFLYKYNTPFSWGETLIFDAYARYKVNADVDIELTGTNLTDQYYADPATRSAMAAPGRTFKLSLTGRF